MRKIWKSGMFYAMTAVLLTGCGSGSDTTVTTTQQTTTQQEATTEEEKTEAVNNTVNTTVAVSGEVSVEGAVEIQLSDAGVTVDGAEAVFDETAAVYVANDIVYYEAGKDFTYGAGTEADEHTAEEAAAHTVVHITQPGSYVVSGSLSAGQIAVDLGDGAKKDPEAVVTLILNGVDINCSVAPGVIFYRVYECGDDKEETAVKDVDTSAAGANVIIADGSVNNVSGSYVARIYKSVELNEAGTEVVSNKKLHKYDGAFYSKMSMNVDGGEKGTGILNIQAENEGLDTELHLTINGGNINITAGNDGINTNEDNVSVTTVNGGTLTIVVDGATGEGDGIDSNGWLVINGGTVQSYACSFSMDSGIDSDKGIYINGGTVAATGNMYDHIADSAQNYAVFSFSSKQSGGTVYTLKNVDGEVVAEYSPVNDFTYLIVSGEELQEGTYSLWADDIQLEAAASEGMGGMMGMPGGMTPLEGMEMPEGMTPPEGMEMPEGMTPPEGMEMPEGMTPPEGMEMPEEMTPPEGMELPAGGFMQQEQATGEKSTELEIKEGGNFFVL